MLHGIFHDFRNVSDPIRTVFQAVPASLLALFPQQFKLQSDIPLFLQQLVDGGIASGTLDQLVCHPPAIVAFVVRFLNRNRRKSARTNGSGVKCYTTTFDNFSITDMNWVTWAEACKGRKRLALRMFWFRPSRICLVESDFIAALTLLSITYLIISIQDVLLFHVNIDESNFLAYFMKFKYKYV